MLSLVADCVDEVLKHGTYMCRLMFASTCKELRCYCPPTKLGNDELLFEVIKSDSLSLLEYYDYPEICPIWDIVLAKNYVLVYIGENISLEPKKKLLTMINIVDIQTVLEHALPGCPIEELDYYLRRYRDLINESTEAKLALRMRGMPDFRLVKASAYEECLYYGQLGLINKIDYIIEQREKDDFNLDEVTARSLLSYHNDFYRRVINNYDLLNLSRGYRYWMDFVRAAKCGNVDIVQFLSPLLGAESKYRVSFDLQTVSVALITACLPHLRTVKSDNYLRSDTFRLLSKDHKQALLMLIFNNFSVPSYLYPKLFGDWIKPWLSPDDDVLETIIDKICCSLKKQEKVSVSDVRRFFATIKNFGKTASETLTKVMSRYDLDIF